MSYLEALSSSVVVDAGAKLASVAGLLFTIYAVYRIGQIRRSFLRRARLPEFRENLREHASEISSFLGSADLPLTSLQAELARCSATLVALGKITPRSVSPRPKAVLQAISKLRATGSDVRQEEVMEVYLILVELERALSYLLDDMRWES